MNRITTNVDQKLLRTTKFPPEFSQKVDTSKIHIPVIKNWAAGEVSKILNYEDDVVINLLFDLLEGSKHPDIKSLQIQLTGFLGKDAAGFCKELWNLCLDAQTSETGIPKQLVEAKKAELLEEKREADRAAEEARRRRDEDRARERDLEEMRYRDRRDRGRGRGGSGRDFERRPRDFSRSPPPRGHRGSAHASRDGDTYVPSRDTGRRPERRFRSRSRSAGRKSPVRSHQPSPKRRRISSRSVSYSPDRRAPRRETDHRRDRSPPTRNRSPARRYRTFSRSRSRSRSRRPRRDDRRRNRSTSRSNADRTHIKSGEQPSQTSRPRSTSREYDAELKDQRVKSRNSSPSAKVNPSEASANSVARSSQAADLPIDDRNSD